jgi:UPF0176 protein
MTSSLQSSASHALPVLNLAAYQFVRLSDLPNLRAQLHQHAEDLGLLGTVLLAEEGINLFLAGKPSAVRAWLGALQQMPAFGAHAKHMEVKESYSAAQPFKKLLVKIKREIIRMNCPSIAPEQGRAPDVDAVTLKRWLDEGHDDEGRPVVMLDTRNAFEVDQGAFVGTIDWRIQKFSEFPQALAAHKDELAHKTVVSYCTGGIRCEKAALLMREQGLSHVYQLDGGILRYFEEVGLAHYQGECFVFDERRAVDAALLPVNDPAGR